MQMNPCDHYEENWSIRADARAVHILDKKNKQQKQQKKSEKD